MTDGNSPVETGQRKDLKCCLTAKNWLKFVEHLKLHFTFVTGTDKV